METRISGTSRFVAMAAAAIAALWMTAFAATVAEPGKRLKIVCTTFPVYLFTKNVAANIDSVQVDLLIPAALGCPHDYAPAPRDIAALAEADLVIVNGLGMEDFLSGMTARVGGVHKIVDASRHTPGDLLLEYRGTHAHSHEDEQDNGGGGHNRAEKDTEHAVNPHAFASPRLAAFMASSIARQLASADHANSGEYLKNARDYAERLNRLAAALAAAGKRLSNNRVIEPHGSFDYFARDMGLRIVAVMQPDGKDLSAAGLIQLIRTAKERDAAAILAEPGFPMRAGETVARETRLPLVRVDPVASGPDAPPLDYYETVMYRNIDTIVDALR